MFVACPSDWAPSLRTHVPPSEQIQACAARARWASRGPRLPDARGRLRRRLGGRPGGPSPRTASPSSAAAQRVLAASPGSVAACSTALHLPRGLACGSATAADATVAARGLLGTGLTRLTRAQALAEPDGPGHLTSPLLTRIADNDDEPPEGGSFVEKTGGVLLSQALAGQVPSALRGLTALFGMGRGVSPSPRPPEKGERPRLPRSLKTAHATAGTTVTPCESEN
jgi:hypothetical protein